jgi:tRNA1Val (adenine37-N6)-methyltransferase
MSDAGRELTHDSLFNGRLTCRQHRDGYRFSVDAVLLAHFFTPQPAETVLDLGTGCGIIPLILAYRRPGLRLTGLELQPQLVELARYNVESNGLADRVRILAGDLRVLDTLLAPGSFQRVVCNPPYRKVDEGRQNPDPEQAVARHELRADLEAVVRASDWLLPVGGKVDLIFPAARRAELLTVMREVGFAPGRMQAVHGYPGGPGKLILLEGIKGGGGDLEIMPPFFICREQGGEHSPEMALCYSP